MFSIQLTHMTAYKFSYEDLKKLIYMCAMQINKLAGLSKSSHFRSSILFDTANNNPRAEIRKIVDVSVCGSGKTVCIINSYSILCLNNKLVLSAGQMICKYIGRSCQIKQMQYNQFTYF